MIFSKEFLNYQDKLYWVYKRIKQTLIKEEFVQDIKTFWDCDMVLRHKNQSDEYFLFLREIPDLELGVEVVPDLK